MASCWQRATLVVFIGVLSLAVPSYAQARGERLSDQQVKKLIEQVDEGRDKFEGNLDDKFKNSTWNGPNGAVKISDALQDYQDNTKKLKDRFSDSNAAAAELTTVLKQAAGIDRFMQGQSSMMQGRREWDTEAASLKHLAEAYGAAFPLPAGATVSRVNDKETADAADAIAKAADKFKNDVDDTKTLAKVDREAAKKDVERLVKLAESLKGLISDGKPAAADVGPLVAQVAKVQAFVDAHQIPALANWKAVQPSLDKVLQSFRLNPARQTTER
jgi:uncharacterized protein YukE